MPPASPYGTIGERSALARGAGQYVLVVAAEPDLAELLSTTLELAGYRISLAGTGVEALARAMEQRFDLVVLDATLPDLADVGRERRPPPAHRPPVLFLTAYDSLDRLLPELGLGEKDYVTKPFRVAEVLARMQVLLRGPNRGPRRDGALACRDLSWTTPYVRHGAGCGRSTSRPPSTGCCATCSSMRTGCSPRSRSAATSGATSAAATRSNNVLRGHPGRVLGR